MAQAASWLEIPPDHPFGLAALPYGSYTAAHHAEVYRVGVAIGDRVLDLTTASDRLLPGRAHLFRSGSLDDFLAAGDGSWHQVRADVTRWLSDETFRPAIEDPESLESAILRQDRRWGEWNKIQPVTP